MDVILVGRFRRDLVPLVAFSVYPTKAGIAVATGTTEEEKALFSSM
jgi:hypothetical protein